MGFQDLQVQPRMLQLRSAHCCLIGNNSLCAAPEYCVHNKVLHFNQHPCKLNVSTQVQLQKTALYLCVLLSFPVQHDKSWYKTAPEMQEFVHEGCLQIFSLINSGGPHQAVGILEPICKSN